MMILRLLFAWRAIGFSAAFLPGLAQGQGQLPALPFVPRQLAPLQVDKALETMLQLTPEQREELRKVDVPLNSEKEFGNSVFKTFQNQLQLQKVGITNRGTDVAYLAKLVGLLKPQMSHHRRYPKIQVHVVDSDEVDARSVPGGILVFYRGLLEVAESEAALIGIVAHELSHLDRRHQLKPLQHQQLAQKQLAGFEAGNFDLGRMFDFGKTSFGSYHPIHPAEESEADRDAVSWMYQVGYDPTELAKLFSRLSDRAQGQAAMLPSFLRTHPLMKDRAAEVLNQSKQLQLANPKPKLIVGVEALRARSPQLK
jgi:Zn-dependent protease with chaperone function